MKAIWGVLLVVCLGIAGIGVINLTNTAEADFIIAVDAGTSPEDQALIERAASVLKSRCPLLSANAHLIIEARGIATGVYRGPAEKLGWEREVEIAIKLSNTGEGLPRRAKEMRASGHTLYYFVGFGGQEGIDIMKDESQAMCADDVQLGGGSNVFVPVQTTKS